MKPWLLHPSRPLTIAALALIALSMLWYGGQVIRFGIDFDSIDLLGAYFLVSGVALVQTLRDRTNRMGESRFALFVCALSIPACALFLGQFLSTFDPFYRVSGSLFAYSLRALFLGAALTTLLALGPHRFLLVPRWLWILAGVVTTGWIFAHACPSILREWYGTRGEPSELFPKGMLILPFRNPERGVRHAALFAAAIAWVGTIVAGRIFFLRARVVKPAPQTVTVG